LPASRKAFERLFFCQKPVVAAIDGHAIAGGCVLPCAADYRMMAQQTGRIGIPELLVGVPFPPLPWRSCALWPHRSMCRRYSTVG
jgi:enoyl-CoA hydratase